MELQATLSASSHESSDPTTNGPHHPITCPGQLAYHPDGRLACPHSEAGPEDPRTRRCVTHSIAVLIIEIATNNGN